MAVSWSDNSVPTTLGADFRDFVEDTGHSILVAIGGAGKIQRTVDGVTWVSVTQAEWSVGRAIAYAPTLGTAGRLCLVESSTFNGGRCATSDDGGATWTTRTSATLTASQWQSINWVPWLNSGSGWFVAVGNSGAVATSPDGITWTSQTSGNVKSWQGLAHSSTTLVATCASSGTQQVMTSPDAVTWTLQTSSAANQNQVGSACGSSVLTYSSTLDMFAYVAVLASGGARYINTSTDQGVTWVTAALPTSRTWTGIYWLPGPSVFVVVAQSSTTRVASSSDGVVWTEEDTGLTNRFWDCIGWMSSTNTMVSWGQGSSTHMLAGVYPVPVLTLTSITPASGPILGGTSVTVTGTNFSADTTLVITDAAGQTLIPLNRVDVGPTTITMDMPAHAAGLISLAAQDGAGSDTLDDCYTYVNDLTAGTDIFGTYSLLRQDPTLGFKEQVNGPSIITYGALGTGAPARPAGLAPIKMIDPNTGDVLGTGLNLQIHQEWMDGPHSPADPLPNTRWSVTATDRRWLLNRRVVTGLWDNVSATVIVQQVLAEFAPAFSAAGVQAGLASISMSAKRDKKVADFLDALCDVLGGADWFLDANDIVNLGFGLESSLTPAAVNDSNTDLLRDPPIEYDEDWSQIRNRVHVRGQAIRKAEGTFRQVLNLNGPARLIATLLNGPSAGNIDFDQGSLTASYIAAYVLSPAAPLTIWEVSDGGTGITIVNCAGRVPYSVGESVTISNVIGSVPDVNGTHTVTEVNGTDFRFLFTLTTAPVVGSGGSVVSNEPTSGLALSSPFDHTINRWELAPGTYSETGNAFNLSVESSIDPQVIAIQFYRAKQHDPNTDGSIFGRIYYLVDEITEGAYDPNQSLIDFVDTKADADLGVQLNAPGNRPFNTESSFEIWATVDDAASQTLVAARLGGTDDGVIETTIDDSSLSTMGDLIKRGQAELDMFAQPLKTVKYATKDRKSRKGREVSIHLSNPPIDNGSGGALVLRIQETTVDQIHENTITVPRYTVVAGLRYTLDQLLARVQLTRSSVQGSSGGSNPGTIATNPGYTGEPTTNLWTIGEIPSGAVNGVNTTFHTVRRFLPNTLQWFIRGVGQQPLVDFTEIDGGFVASVAPTAFMASGQHWVNYRG